MTTINRMAIVRYSCEQLFDLVDDIEQYPLFLPGCRSAIVKERIEPVVIASLEIVRMGMHKTFTTRNQNDKPYRITMQFLDGPFKYLNGTWQFEPLGNGCKISLHIDYELSGGLMNKMFGGVFHQLADSLVDAFCERAKVMYG